MFFNKVKFLLILVVKNENTGEYLFFKRKERWLFIPRKGMVIDYSYYNMNILAWLESFFFCTTGAIPFAKYEVKLPIDDDQLFVVRDEPTWDPSLNRFEVHSQEKVFSEEIISRIRDSRCWKEDCSLSNDVNILQQLKT